MLLRNTTGKNFSPVLSCCDSMPDVCESWISSSARQSAKVLTLE